MANTRANSDKDIELGSEAGDSEAHTASTGVLGVTLSESNPLFGNVYNADEGEAEDFWVYVKGYN